MKISMRPVFFHAIWLICIVSLIFGATTETAWAAGTSGTRAWTAGNLEIHHINIGQGDSTLVVRPTGKSLLFDAGESNWNSSSKAQIIGRISGLIPEPSRRCGPTYQTCSVTSISCQVVAGQVVINEVFPSPSNNGTEWVELFNTTGNPVDIGYCLIDDIAGGSTPYQIPASTIIPAHGFWTLDRNGYFNNTGDSVRFIKEDAETLLETFTYGNTGTNLSWVRLPNGGPWSATPTSATTKGTSNTGLPPTTFVDVPATHLYYSDIEILYANGLTAGCTTSPLKFCPDQIMDRAQAAVFILRGNFGNTFVPDPAQHIFNDDWTKGPWAEPWAEAMRNKGLSAGCLLSPLKYCPWNQIPREQAVIFALRLKYGNSYTPPPATGTLLADMTNPSYYATPWVEQAYKDGLIPSCGTSGGKPKICPKSLVTRGLGAYMIVRAKNLTMP